MIRKEIKTLCNSIILSKNIEDAISEIKRNFGMKLNESKNYNGVLNDGKFLKLLKKLELEIHTFESDVLILEDGNIRINFDTVYDDEKAIDIIDILSIQVDEV